jgi:4-amino-4-deoxy-L-arabinose transferase-like glycosyltransferase
LSVLRRYLPLVTLLVATAGFYLYQLDAVGVLGPDEPRYAAIGQAMAQTDDLVTPRLWGSPWFEKPPLLYWMTAAGTTAGLNPELAARLPVALLSLFFLAGAFALLRHEFGTEAATVSVTLLATSAGWVAYSSLCLTDLPLAVFFSFALLLALPLLSVENEAIGVPWRFAAIGVCLGLAMLAKGLVPIALALPGVWFLRRWWRKCWLAVVFCCLVAGPWYVAVYLRNGQPFIEEFFLKHHFERLYSPSLQHVQPWYYYLPVLLAGLFPWTPLLALLAGRGSPSATWRDPRRRFLLATVLFGLVLFSVSLNKLPGYLLPLLPALFALVGAQFAHKQVMELGRIWLVPCAVLIAGIPLLAHALPDALIAGRITALHIARISPTEVFYIAAPLAALFLARRSWAGPLLILCVVAGGIYLKTTAYPVLDERVSARDLWRQVRRLPGTVCDAGINRDWLYGLNFYRGVPLPACGSAKFDFVLRSQDHAKPLLESRSRILHPME